jgi:predicted ester cyclase
MPLDDIIVEGDRIAMRHSFRGTHKAPFQGIPATDRSVVVTAIVTVRVSDGKVVEGWLHADFFGLLQQLGVIPQPS